MNQATQFLLIHIFLIGLQAIPLFVPMTENKQASFAIIIASMQAAIGQFQKGIDPDTGNKAPYPKQ